MRPYPFSHISSRSQIGRTMYAKTLYRLGPYHQKPINEVFHRVDPIMKGNVAYCRFRIDLDMSTAINEEPPSNIYCQKCRVKDAENRLRQQHGGAK